MASIYAVRIVLHVGPAKHMCRAGSVALCFACVEVSESCTLAFADPSFLLFARRPVMYVLSCR